MIPAFDVIIPVCNEAHNLKTTAPLLKQALSGLPANVIYALNGTTDESGDIINAVFGNNVQVLSLPHAGKTTALLAADRISRHPIRVYLDADILIEPETIPALLEPLVTRACDFTGARLVADLSQSRGVALRISRVWADQLARRVDAFMCCTAINSEGLKQRGPWPMVLADDDWARNRIDPERRRIIESAKATMSPPRTLRDWLVVRARWIRGTKELKKLGERYKSPQHVQPRGSATDLAAYFFIRMAAEPLALIQILIGIYWGRDNSTRTRKHA